MARPMPLFAPVTTATRDWDAILGGCNGRSSERKSFCNTTRLGCRCGGRPSVTDAHRTAASSTCGIVRRLCKHLGSPLMSIEHLSGTCYISPFMTATRLWDHCCDESRFWFVDRIYCKEATIFISPTTSRQGSLSSRSFGGTSCRSASSPHP
jgi:hypothetical protein